VCLDRPSLKKCARGLRRGGDTMLRFVVSVGWALRDVGVGYGAALASQAGGSRLANNRLAQAIVAPFLVDTSAP